MTVDEAKEKLPDVLVRCGANMTVLAQTSGRKEPYATVTLPSSPGGTPSVWQFSWESIARAATEGRCLQI
jgi:hypothetical protein